MGAFIAVLATVAMVSAVRGVWSPCGLSMLSSITPMSEAGRGNRFGVTAAWFTIGATLGGLSLGAIAALGAGGVQQLDLAMSTRAGIAAVLATATASIDVGLAGIALPIFKRQVNDAWLRNYRSWVYGAGFGFQIGFGLATYIMTAGVFLVVGLAILSASPFVALVGCTTFGLVRGLAVFVGRSATTPARLATVHHHLDAWSSASRSAAAVVQVLASGVMAGLAFGPLLGLALVVALGAAWGLTGRVGTSRNRSAAVSN